MAVFLIVYVTPVFVAIVPESSRIPLNVRYLYALALSRSWQAVQAPSFIIPSFPNLEDEKHRSKSH